MDEPSSTLNYKPRHSTSRPTLRDLATHVIPSVKTKWFELGLQLLDEKYENELNTIDDDTKNDAATSCRKMFSKWLQTKETASWDLLVQGLKTVQLITLAKDIEQLLLQGNTDVHGKYDGGSLGSHHVCKICQAPCRITYLSSCCGHILCKSCINKSKNTATFKNICPICHSHDFVVVQNMQIDCVIGCYQVHCDNEKEGCKWQGKVNDRLTHLNNCQYENIVCENNGCGNIVQRQHLKSHMELECPYRNVACQHCLLRGDYQFIEGKHKDECPKLPLSCPNGCEVGTVTREDFDKHKNICPLEMIECEYYDMGCMTKILRKECTEHNRKNAEEHLRAVKCVLARTKSDLIQTQKDAKSTENKLVDMQKKLQDQTAEKQLANSQKELQEQLLTAKKKLIELENKFQEKITDTEIRGQERIKRLEAQLYNSVCQLHKNCDPWTLKLNALATLSASGEQVVPVVIKLINFSKMKRDNECLRSAYFYSHNKECKMQLSVCENNERCSTYLSVRLSFTYYNPKWELKGNIKLLNQIGDQGHHCVAVQYCETNTAAIYYQCMKLHEWRNCSFISYCQLNAVSKMCNFIKNDCLYFKVRIEKSQSSCPLQKEDTCKTYTICPTSSPKMLTTGSCNKCNVSFARVMKRKHTCSQCGGDFCGSCTVVLHQCNLEEMSWFSETMGSNGMRVCIGCSEQIKLIRCN